MVERGRDGQQGAGGVMAGECWPERSSLGGGFGGERSHDVVLSDLNE